MLPVLDSLAVFVVFHIWSATRAAALSFQLFLQWNFQCTTMAAVIEIVLPADNPQQWSPFLPWTQSPTTLYDDLLLLFSKFVKNKQSQRHLWRRATNSAPDDEWPSRSQLGRLAFHFKPWIKVARRDLTGKCTWLTLECLWKHFLLWLERLRMEDLVTANDSQMRTQQSVQIFPLLFHSAPYPQSSTSIRIHRISGSIIFLQFYSVNTNNDATVYLYEAKINYFSLVIRLDLLIYLLLLVFFKFSLFLILTNQVLRLTARWQMAVSTCLAADLRSLSNPIRPAERHFLILFSIEKHHVRPK